MRWKTYKNGINTVVHGDMAGCTVDTPTSVTGHAENHLDALRGHTRSLGQMLTLFNIHWIQERVHCDCWDEIADRPAFVWMHMKTKRKGSVCQGLFQQNKAWTTYRKIVAGNCHQVTAKFTKGKERQKPMPMYMERYLGERADWYSGCHKRPSLAEVKGRA